MQKEILCIDPAALDPEYSCFHSIQKLIPMTLSHHLCFLEGMESIYAREKEITLKGIILLGSYKSVLENSKQQKNLTSWLINKLNAKIPILAICYGHQLFAQFFGAEINSCSEKLSINCFRNISLTSDIDKTSKKKEFIIACSHREK